MMSPDCIAERELIFGAYFIPAAAFPFSLVRVRAATLFTIATIAKSRNVQATDRW